MYKWYCWGSTCCTTHCKVFLSAACMLHAGGKYWLASEEEPRPCHEVLQSQQRVLQWCPGERCNGLWEGVCVNDIIANIRYICMLLLCTYWLYAVDAHNFLFLYSMCHPYIFTFVGSLHCSSCAVWPFKEYNNSAIGKFPLQAYPVLMYAMYNIPTLTLDLDVF